MADRAVNLETVIGMVNTYFRNVLNLDPDLLIDGIVSLPTVDAVEVVRCRECRWCNMGECEHKFGLLVSNDENYCSYGERDVDI